MDSGAFQELGALYDTLHPGRLVILGPAGAGKTVLAAQLADALLAAARRRSPVEPIPVMMSIAPWDPGTTSFEDWVADRLAHDHKLLDSRLDDDRRLADVLVKDHHRVLPVLDGFDELAEHLRPVAVRALSAEHQWPLVLTSRVDEYRAALDAGGDGVLAGAAVVQLAPMTPEDVAEYLRRSTQRTATTGEPLWDGVVRALRSDAQEAGSLRRVLTNPLMAFLACTAYSRQSGQDPADLLRDDRRGPRPDLEDHLLARFLPAVYDDTLPANRDAENRWPRGRAVKWLTGLAHHLKDTGTRDLAWWRLTDLVHPGAQVLVAAAFISLTSMIGAVVAGCIADGSLAGALVYAMGGLSSGALVGVAVGALTQQVRPGLLRYRLRLSRPRLRAGRLPVLIGLAAWLMGSPLGIPYFTAVVVISTAAGVVGAAFVVAEEERYAPNPQLLLIKSRTTAVINSVVVVISGSLGSWLLGLSGVGTFVWALPVALLATVWGRWLLFVRLWLPLRGRLPWLIHAFLADACDRGVLRQSGAVYHFRHARLQDQLAPPDIDSADVDDRVTAFVVRLARTTAGSGEPTTLVRLARELGCDVTTARTALLGLIAGGAARVGRGTKHPHGNEVQPQREATPLADLPEHARFTLHLTAPSTAQREP